MALQWFLIVTEVVTKNQTFHYTHRIMPKRVMTNELAIAKNGYFNIGI